jgi:hypothetical protein
LLVRFSFPLLSDAGMFIPEILRSLLSEEACADLPHRVRRRDGVTCPICGSREVKAYYTYEEGNVYPIIITL